MPDVAVDAATAHAFAANILWKPAVPIADAPRIYVIDDFASAAECEEIFNTAEPHLEHSLTQSNDGKVMELPKGRRSRQYTLSPHRWTPNIMAVVDRIDAASMQPLENGQHITITECTRARLLLLSPFPFLSDGLLYASRRRSRG